MKSVLFLVNGYGLGNSARAHSLIQCLGPELEIDLFGYGNSFKYFKPVPRIRQLFKGFSMEYGARSGQIDWLSTIGKAPKNARAFFKNRQKVREIIKRNSYSLIVSDSDYSAVFLKNRPKLISINNANVIVKKSRGVKKRGCYFHFMTELADSLFHRLAPDLVISPFFEKMPDSKKIRQISIMARKQFQIARNFESHPPQKHHVLIMTGGNESLGPNIPLSLKAEGCDLSVLGDQIRVLGKAQKIKRSFDSSALMARASIVAINGGFSSVSEALAMAKPMIVIPLKGHIEQKINAHWVEENKMGVVSSWGRLEEAIGHVRKNYRQFKQALLNYKNLSGAEQAARILLKEMKSGA